MKLFGFEPGDDVYDGMKKKVNLLTDELNLVDGYKSIVDGSGERLSSHHIFNLHIKALYLRCAYVIVLKYWVSKHRALQGTAVELQLKC